MHREGRNKKLRNKKGRKKNSENIVSLNEEQIHIHIHTRILQGKALPYPILFLA
jgi:hypothetical protein